MSMLTYKKLGQMGRFGNQLWQIASTIGMANRGGHQYAFPEWKYRDFFVHRLPELTVDDSATSLLGYLQDYRNFIDYEDVIFNQFIMKDKWGKDFTDRVFIHFRAYANEKMTHYHPEQTREYYTEAKKCFEGRGFVVFSDDIERARCIIPKENCIFVGGEDMYAFYQMTHCAGGIIANSSFSWWAGFMNGGPVVIPKKWYTSKAPYDSTGLYIPEWIKI